MTFLKTVLSTITRAAGVTAGQPYLTLGKIVSLRLRIGKLAWIRQRVRMWRVWVALASSMVAVTAWAQTKHYEYVFPDKKMYIYDMDNGFALVKSVKLPTSGTRGAVACVGNSQLYVSWGPDNVPGSTGHIGHLLAYDYVQGRLLWTQSYTHGIDSHAVAPDCSFIYMPDGEASPDGTWYVETTATGADVGTIAGPKAPHNTIINDAGTHLYMDGRQSTFAEAALTSSDAVYLTAGPLQSTMRPFTINGKETLLYTSVTGLLGFQVVDLMLQKVIYTVPIQGFTNTCTSNCPSDPSHGISLSPDEKELYVIDYPNDYVHVFDLSQVPASAPAQVADIRLAHSLHHIESPCPYDCMAGGWLHHSRDGRFVFVGDSGDVISTAGRQVVAYLPAMKQTKKEIEIDFLNGVPSFAMNNRSSIGYVH